MPSLAEVVLHPVSLSVFALYAILIAWEALLPARRLPQMPYWRLRGLAAFALYFGLSSYLPLLWTDQLLRFQLFDLGGLGTVGGALVGVLVYELAVYAWHRGLHASNLMWRVFHQMHHSAERLDTWSAFWFSPMDMVGFSVLYSLCLTLVVGLSAEAATAVLLITTFFSVFQHANIRTPRWLGYLIQRPESHSRHHERGVHAQNYSDLPLIDLLFRSFHNPRDFSPEQGLHDGASLRVPEMLAFHDVSQPPAPHSDARGDYA